MNLGEGLKKIGVSAYIELIKKQKRLLISDTTLRDGEQAPGASLDVDQKLTIARQLGSLGVNSIEAGFPASSKEDLEAVKLIAKEVKGPVISALSRCSKGDITTAAEALKGARHWSISLFLGTSPILRKYSLNKSKEEVLAIMRDAIGYARGFTDNIAFGAEDATRTEPDFLYKVYNEAIDAGARAIGFPDTVGWLIPGQAKEMIEGIKKNVPGLNRALLAIHFHNDLGLAVANSLAAVECGVNVVQCTINGLGERAGNASLEELVMAIRTRKDHYKVNLNINTKELFKTSCLVSELTGIAVSSNKPIVGRNVFATEAGIHQAALLKKESTYVIIKPEEVGQDRTTIFLGRHSGKHAISHKLKNFGYKMGSKDSENQLETVYRKFKELAVTKKEVTEDELAKIAREVLNR
ncbi:MAG: 2-isopropylmalate synthase [Candidatus Omnitrophica bacterium]|nr:2-isopropylmalate synthase [Candidatus Omnitrophota bacterium]